MHKYTVRIADSVVKKLSKLPTDVENKIVISIESLIHNPRPHGCKKLKARDGYRVRVGDYRIIYQIIDNILTVLVLDIGHRKDIYQ
ncbi:MAG: type II toxin-antitoxin system RelE/ParE family toxin [Pyrinomonadaceae bacterium]|nr:type II toxin-antitoxin system RelE/ParE family toxin [Sphingobacteriaceae bacterium]